MPETVCKPARQLKENRVQTFVIGAGSNLGSPSDNLARGLSMLCRLPELSVTAVSRVYESDGVGPPQPRYLNAAVRAVSAQPALELLAQLLAIEAALGRVRDVRWGPRTLDLDLLWAEHAVTNEQLQVPHPHLRQRPFALAPLLDVAPELAPEYAPVLSQLGGAPELWGELSIAGDEIAIARIVRAAV